LKRELLSQILTEGKTYESRLKAIEEKWESVGKCGTHEKKVAFSKGTKRWEPWWVAGASGTSGCTEKKNLSRPK